MRKDKLAKFVCFVSCLFICFCVVKIFMNEGVKTVVASAFSGGSGTEVDPYLISTVNDLKQLSDDTHSGNNYNGKYFKMTRDIDFNNSGVTSKSGSYISGLKGVFDGNGHIIRNFSFGDALFYGNATVKNLGMKDCIRNVNGKTNANVELGILFAGFAGHATDCFIIDSSVSENNNGNSTIYGGKFAGFSPGGTVEDCYAYGGGIHTGTTNAAGYELNCFCHATGNVTIKNCFVSTGYGSGNARQIGVFCDNRATATNCYYQITNAGSEWRRTSGQANVTEKDPSTLTVADLSSSYRLSISAGHPVLKVFDPEITITNSSNVSSIIKQNASSGISIGVSLSRTLNTQGQNDSVKVYLDNTLISTVTSSQTVTIPRATLNDLSIGSHTVIAKLISDTNSIVKTSNGLTITVNAIPTPAISSIVFTNNNQTSYSMIHKNANEDLTVSVTIDRAALNLNGQDNKFYWYLDDSTTTIVEPTTSQTLTIPKSTLNGYSVGTHKIKTKIIDTTNNTTVTGSDLTLNIAEIPIPNIESVTTSDNKSISDMFVNEAPNGGLQLKVNLSREQLNLNGQNYDIGLYLDGNDNELGTLLVQESSTTFTIPKNTLNSWTVGEHKITAKLLDNNAVVKTCAEDLIFMIHEDVYPEIEKINILPTGHRKSHIDNLSSVSVTLTGKNFSTGYSANLVFKNEAGAEVLNLSLGKFNKLSTTSQTFNITGTKLQQIKELEIAKYSVEVEVSK